MLDTHNSPCCWVGLLSWQLPDLPTHSFPCQGSSFCIKSQENAGTSLALTEAQAASKAGDAARQGAIFSHLHCILIHAMTALKMAHT